MKRAMLCGLVAACCGTIASAHEFWIQPGTFTPRAGQALQVGLMVGDGFPGEPVARNPQRIVKFEAVGPLAKHESSGNANHGASASAGAPITGRPGADPAGQITLADPGTTILVYESNHARVELEPEKFDSYLREDGMEHIISKRQERGESDKPGREAYSRACKALVRVQASGDASDQSGGPKQAMPEDRVVGLHHEIVLLNITDEDPKTPGVTLHIRDLFGGKPLEHANVCVRSPQHPGEKLCARTDASGEARIDVAWSGMLLVSAVHMVEAPPALREREQVEWQSTWASLAFELLPTPANSAATPAVPTK
jgi:hypothetical protein